MFAEVSSNLARYDGIRYGSVIDGDSLLDVYRNTRSQLLGTEVKRRIILGTYVLSAGYADDYYVKALALREKIKQELRSVYEKYDFILTPTAPNPAFKIGEKIDDPLTLYLEDIYTVSANITGCPAISVPSGFVRVEGKNLPVGIQFMATHGSDRAVLDMARKFEQG
jgi:aspartyl-tRNA(Asn)/glutamyl-tRNA(Gln) amidotransferase subunit A